MSGNREVCQGMHVVIQGVSFLLVQRTTVRIQRQKQMPGATWCDMATVQTELQSHRAEKPHNQYTNMSTQHVRETIKNKV